VILPREGKGREGKGGEGKGRHLEARWWCSRPKGDQS